MYKCPECGEIFEEPVYEEVCMEDLYGVGSMFSDRHYKTICTCPECGEYIDIEEDFYYEEDDEEEEDEDDE